MCFVNISVFGLQTTDYKKPPLRAILVSLRDPEGRLAFRRVVAIPLITELRGIASSPPPANWRRRILAMTFVCFIALQLYCLLAYPKISFISSCSIVSFSKSTATISSNLSLLLSKISRALFCASFIILITSSSIFSAVLSL